MRLAAAVGPVFMTLVALWLARTAVTTSQACAERQVPARRTLCHRTVQSAWRWRSPGRMIRNA